MSDIVKTNSYGEEILSSDNLRELILQGKNIHHLTVNFDEDIELFLKHQHQLLKQPVKFLEPTEKTIPFEEYHRAHAEEWLIPEEYKSIDVKHWLLTRCKTNEEAARVELEYEMYLQRDLIMLLRTFIYVVDYMRSNRIIWGVGRGSAVSSYILYLIGIHKVNSIKYNLPITDFLKEDYD